MHHDIKSGRLVGSQSDFLPLAQTPVEPGGSSVGVSQTAELDPIYRRIRWRLMPLLLVAQVLAYLDRVNIGTAKLQMAVDLDLSATVYGLGAGIFFLGYFIFEVPSNVLLHRLGARTWIARIMITWGIASGATMFVHSVTGFYIQRLLLGVAEAGFFPGIVLYLTYWFPPHRRGRMTTLFMSATAVSGIIGGPLSGWILLSLNGYHALEGWRWMFLLEAVPSILVGVLVFFYLPSKPSEVDWLTGRERELVERDLAAFTPADDQRHRLRVLLNGSIALFAVIYFLLLAGLYGVSFWLPSLIKAAGISDTFTISWLSAIPFAVAAVSMNIVAHSADRTRKWGAHVGISAIIAGAGFLGSVFYAHQIVLATLALTVASAGILSALPLFWNLPTQRLAGTAAAAGIALINSVGNLAGFVSPFMIGWLTDRTHSATAGVSLLGVAAAFAGIVTLAYGRRRARCPLA
jgi:MFS family permease